MRPVERYTNEVLFKNTAGRQYPVKFYVNPEGYVRDGEHMACTSCGKPAVHRLEIYNHIYEPQGSEYYCNACVPKPELPTGD